MQITVSNGMFFLNYYKRHSSCLLNAQVSYKLTKIALGIEEELTFFSKKIDELSQLYGEKDENGNLKKDSAGNIIVQKDKQKECQDKVNEIQNCYFDLTVPALSFKDLCYLETTNEEMIELINFIEEEED